MREGEERRRRRRRRKREEKTKMTRRRIKMTRRGIRVMRRRVMRREVQRTRPRLVIVVQHVQHVVDHVLEGLDHQHVCAVKAAHHGGELGADRLQHALPLLDLHHLLLDEVHGGRHGLAVLR